MPATFLLATAVTTARRTNSGPNQQEAHATQAALLRTPSSRLQTSRDEAQQCPHSWPPIPSAPSSEQRLCSIVCGGFVWSRILLGTCGLRAINLKSFRSFKFSSAWALNGSWGLVPLRTCAAELHKCGGRPASISGPHVIHICLYVNIPVNPT